MYAFEQHLPSKKLLAPLAQLAEQLTLNHADVEVNATMLPNTLRFGSAASFSSPSLQFLLISSVGGLRQCFSEPVWLVT
jgi:hypothetical protein